MDLNVLFKAVVDAEREPVVLCDLEHTVLYMNPASVARYGVDITGRSIMNCHNADSCQKIERVVEWFKKSRENNVVHTAHSNKTNSDLYMVALRDTDGNLLGYYEKYEPRNLEHTAPYAAMAEDRE